MDIFYNKNKGKVKTELRKLFKYVKPNDEFIKSIFSFGGLQENIYDINYYSESISVKAEANDYDINFFILENDFEVYSGFASSQYLPKESEIMQKGLAQLCGKKYVKACAKFEQAKLDERKRQLDEDQKELDSRIKSLNEIAETPIER